MDRELWKTIKKEIKLREDAEPSLGPFLHSLISSQTDLLAAVASDDEDTSAVKMSPQLQHRLL